MRVAQPARAAYAGRAVAAVTTPQLLLVLFIGLRLADVITWPWLWVLAPLWLPYALVLAVLAVVGVTALIVAVVIGWQKDQQKRRRKADRGIRLAGRL